MYCTLCGHLLPDDCNYCDNCGSPVQTSQSQTDHQKTYVSESASSPKTNHPKKPKSLLILSFITFALLVCCCVFGAIAIHNYDIINENNKMYNDLLDECRKIRPIATFFEDRAVIVTNNSGKKYHKYTCYEFQGNIWPHSKSYWIYNTEAARNDGYKPCPICCK